MVNANNTPSSSPLDGTWTLAGAKARFSEVVDCAQAGPQTITRNGKSSALVVSAEEWARKTVRKGTLAEFLSHRRCAAPISSWSANRRSATYSSHGLSSGTPNDVKSLTLRVTSRLGRRRRRPHISAQIPEAARHKAWLARRLWWRRWPELVARPFGTGRADHLQTNQTLTIS